MTVIEHASVRLDRGLVADKSFLKGLLKLVRAFIARSGLGAARLAARHKRRSPTSAVLVASRLTALVIAMRGVTEILAASRLASHVCYLRVKLGSELGVLNGFPRDFGVCPAETPANIAAFGFFLFRIGRLAPLCGALGGALRSKLIRGTLDLQFRQTSASGSCLRLFRQHCHFD